MDLEDIMVAEMSDKDKHKDKYDEVSACNVRDLGLIPGSGIFFGELATHSSILPKKIPWTEEPGELLSMGSQRAGHD